MGVHSWKFSALYQVFWLNPLSILTKCPIFYPLQTRESENLWFSGVMETLVINGLTTNPILMPKKKQSKKVHPSSCWDAKVFIRLFEIRQKKKKKFIYALDLNLE